MSTLRYIIGIALLLTGVLPANSQVSNDNEDRVNKIDTRFAALDYVPGQVLVKFKDSNRVTVRRVQGRFTSTSVDKLTAVLQKYGTDEMEQLLPNENPNRRMRRARAYNGAEIQERDLSQLYCLKLTTEHQHETIQMVEELNVLDEVEYAEPNYYCYIMGETIADDYGTNPMVSKQWYLDAYGVTELWNKPIINPERPVIAIIDTGVDTTHPDLKDNCIAGYDFVNGTTNVYDDNMHGTHVAGIAAACHNETGIIGANPRALIMPIKVMDKNGKGDGATVLRGVAYAVEHGAKILNLSLGGYGYSKAAADVYRNASLNAIIVAAAGNDSKCIYSTHSGLLKHGIQPAPSFPGAYSFVLGVQATNRKGDLASFSNYDDDGPTFSCEASLEEPDGFNYELKAPGTEIFSTLPGGNYGELQGTSMASPLVAGAISALMMVKQYDSYEQLWAELLHTNNIAETYELTELPADLDVVQIMLRERKEFTDEETYISNTEDVNAGETINIYPVIRCTSKEASNVKLRLEVDDYEDPNCVQIIIGEADFGWHLDAMGKAVSKNPLVVKIPEDIADSRHIRMRIMVSCENQEGTSSRPFTFIANNMETISGLITEDRTLYTGHAYYVNNHVVVDKDITLTIEPGTRLEFASGKSLGSNGKLVAKGTIEKPIVFTGHLGIQDWGGIFTRKKSGKKIGTGLYTNSEQSLFTLSQTESTPFFLSNNIAERRYISPSSELKSKTFYLSDYIEGWDNNKNLIDNVYGYESLLTDPNFLTPSVLKMLEDFNAYLGLFGSDEYGGTNTIQATITAELLKWTTYSDYGDTIAYCIIENFKEQQPPGSFDNPYMHDCILRHCFNSTGKHGARCIFTENNGYNFHGVTDNKYWNVINNSDGFGLTNVSLFGPKYSDLAECNYFNNPSIFGAYYNKDAKYDGVEYWLLTGSEEPEVDNNVKHPSYLGTAREDIVRPHVFELGNAPDVTWGTIDLSNMRTTPVTEAHGIVWKVLVNGKDAQDEYEELLPLGVGRHKFEVYFNRPMNKAVIPKISFGVRDPWTQNNVDEDAGWNEEGTIYTAYITITGKLKSDGINRIYVRGAEDDEFFPCPYEKSRFNINVQVAGSMATGFMAEASVGRVNLTWNNENNDFEDAMGYNVYRFNPKQTKTIPGHYENGKWIAPHEIVDTIRINEDILSIETCEYTDCDVIPNNTYYYLYKVLSTDLIEYDVSNIVAATPLTATMGDANGSGEVDVADVVTTVNYAVGNKPDPFIFDAADMNTDKNIDVLDVIGIVQKILNPEAGVRAMVEATATYTIEDGTLYVESPVSLAGVQVQISLTPGPSPVSEGSIKVAEDLDGFEHTSAWLSDNDYLFLAYSMNGKTLSPGKHALLHIGDALIASMRLSDANGHNVEVIGDDATKVNRMASDVMKVPGIYDLKGRKLTGDSTLEGKLPKGVYIVNGRKVVH